VPDSIVETYISRYSGYTKFNRLQHIAEQSSSQEVRVAAKQALVKALRQSPCVELYVQECTQEQTKEYMGPEFTLDQAWVDETEQKNLLEQNELESDLHAKKGDMIKEHIRLAYKKLGDFHYKTGKMHDAQKAYARMKDSCSSAEHTMEMCLKISLAFMDVGQFESALLCVVRGEASDQADVPVMSRSKLRATLGVLSLWEGRFRDAADHFLSLPSFIGNEYNEVVASSDVATYCSLCALTVMNRAVVQQRLLSPQSPLNPYYETAPRVRRIVQAYCTGDFVSVFTDLADMRAQCMLDMYLGKHFDKMVCCIKDRVAVQYFRPYDTARLGRLVEVTGLPAEEVNSIVTRLVADGDIPARIDAETGTLHRLKQNERQSLLKEVLGATQAHAREMQATMLRLSMMRQGFFVGEDCEHNCNGSVFPDKMGEPQLKSSSVPIRDKAPGLPDTPPDVASRRRPRVTEEEGEGGMDDGEMGSDDEGASMVVEHGPEANP